MSNQTDNANPTINSVPSYEDLVKEIDFEKSYSWVDDCAATLRQPDSVFYDCDLPRYPDSMLHDDDLPSFEELVKQVEEGRTSRWSGDDVQYVQTQSFSTCLTKNFNTCFSKCFTAM